MWSQLSYHVFCHLRELKTVPLEVTPTTKKKNLSSQVQVNFLENIGVGRNAIVRMVQVWETKVCTITFISLPAENTYRGARLKQCSKYRRKSNSSILFTIKWYDDVLPQIAIPTIYTYLLYSHYLHHCTDYYLDPLDLPNKRKIRAHWVEGPAHRKWTFYQKVLSLDPIAFCGAEKECVYV